MASEESLPVLKILVIGPSGAGKSSLLLRYCNDQFDPESTTATIGIDFMTKKLAVDGKGYRLNIFDTAGQERYRTLSTSYYRGAHGVIVVYDISNRKSFLSLDRWIEEARSNASENAVIYLVGTKLDKVAPGATRAVSAEEAKAFAHSQGAGYCEVSAKTRANIKQPFVEVVGEIVRHPELLSAGPSKSAASKRLDLSAAGAQGNSSYCSC
ncbi:P-loop containing nucleoside triphosphate hydrolase protein [Microdochium bolleyi]|uniref:p-loop containing nucleoside triphosphate hydrolase protein n=1 Tax=Microdochium bolleyi TaxID=196109 RepID=A0A136J6T8_9PEZI|nr:P-loop containing nucleoside triphosphate hydrolase protein [Microdochium bolleyi]